MKWLSTRGASPAVPFIDALFAGTAPDGGLYFPDRFEPLPAATLASLRSASLVDVGTIVGSHLLQGEITPEALRPLIADALDFPIPLVQVSERVYALELFQELGHRYGQAETLGHLGDTYAAMGSPDLARDAWRRALETFEELKHADAEQVRAKLRALDA